MYKSHISEIVQQVKDSPETVSDGTLKAFAQFAKAYPMEIPTDEGLYTALESFILTGTPKQAKYAVTIVANSEKREVVAKRLVDQIVNNIAYGTEYFLTELSALSQLTLTIPEVVEDRADEITSFTIKELLLKNRSEDGVDDASETWQEQESVDEECLAKCYAVTILGNRLRANHSATTATELAKPVFKMLNAITVNMGEVTKTQDTPKRYQSRLRLTAAKMVLKLACLPKYEALITNRDFLELSLFAQDLEYQVRLQFLNKCKKSLGAGLLGNRYYTILFLATFDPEKEIKLDTKKWLMTQAQAHRAFPVCLKGDG